MSITTNDNRIRLESAAKNGALSVQGALNADQIKFDSNISTNNSNLEVSPSFPKRHVTIRKGDADEEEGIVKSVDVDGVTCVMQDDWVSAPVSGDTYDVSYVLPDVATIVGCDFETDSRQWAIATKRLVIGAAGSPGYLGMSQGQVLRCADRGLTEADLDLGADGRFSIGTIRNDVANLGATVIFTSAADNYLCISSAIGSVMNLYEFTLMSARTWDGVNSLDVTLNGTVNWSRGQLYGIDAPIFKTRTSRFEDVLGEYVLSVADIKASPMWDAWLLSPYDKSLRDAVLSDANAAQVRFLIEG